jgi:antitoxin MazE
MEAVIRKWGNSPALRLPTAVLKEAGYRLEQKVNLLVSRGRIIIQPSKKIEYDIDELVNGIHAKNTHDVVSTDVMLHFRAKMKALLQIP